MKNTYNKIVGGLLLFVLIMASFTSKAQNFELQEDFTITDINGETHNLYEYLDEGKTVFVELFATWCSSCWSHHQQGYFKELWELRGPEGTNDVMILMIEEDLNTAEAGIYGDGSFGDWTAETPYPIFNITTAEEDNIFSPSSYPTFYTITPNRVITEFEGVHFINNYVDIVEAALPVATQDSEIAILAYNGDTEYCESLNTAITIQNLGLMPLNLAEIVVRNESNEEVAVFGWQGNLNTYEIETISLDAFDFDVAMQNLTFEAIPSGNGVGNYSNLTVGFERPTTTSDTINLEITTDNFGFETYWAVLNENNEIVADGGNPEVGLNGGGLQTISSGGYESNATFNEEIILEANQCYSFVVIDDYADGICCNNGNGFFRLTTPNGELLHINDGEFTDRFELTFKVSGETEPEEPEEPENPEEPEEDILAASFSYEIEGNTVIFTNLSTGSAIENYTWSFGDGYYDFSAEPAAHTYGGPGEYPVSLYISNASGSAYFSETIVIGSDAATDISDIEKINNFTISSIGNGQLIQFTSERPDNANISIVNALGQVINSRNVAINQGENQLIMDTNYLPNAWYAVVLSTEKSKFVRRFLQVK